jgi:hypothetical protein
VGALALAEIARLLEGVRDGEEGEQEIAMKLCGELDLELDRFRGALSAQA